MKDKLETSEAGNRKISRRGLLSVGAILGALGIGGGFLYRHISSTPSIHVESFVTPGSGEKKNVLVVTGSARRGGNTEVLTDAFIDGAKNAGHEVNVFHAGRTPMMGRLHCDSCWNAGEPCVVRDSFYSFSLLLEQAEVLVVASPLYWYNFSGHVKCAIDRLYAYSSKNRYRDLKIKEAMLLMCGESHFPRSFAGAAESWRQILGLQRWRDRGRLFVTGVNEYGEMKKDRALEKASEMGRMV